MVSDGEKLIGLWIENQINFQKTIKDAVAINDDIAAFVQAKEWLDRYFAGEVMSIGDLPIALKGSPFREKVWSILCDIPYGKLVTYGDIAKEIAVSSAVGRESAQAEAPAKMSAQAVGGAVGHNPISIIVPCHRVIGADCKLTGYGGGLDLKIKLLEIEGFTIDKDKMKVVL